LVDGVEIDGNWQQLTVNAGEDAVFVGPPLGEARKILENWARIRVKNVGAVFVYENAVVVVVIVCVPTDVVAGINY
jgi:hypothetical protein